MMGEVQVDPQQVPLASAIVIERLTKSFGQNKVLHGLDMRIEPGEFVGLMGPNGAGKSTLIKILAGVYTPTGGTIRYGDQAVSNFSALPEIGFVHQDLGLIEDLSITDNLRLGEKPLRRVGPLLNHGEERAAAARALERVGLELPVNTMISDLSPGEQALVAVARTLHRGARVLFIDETTSSLPPRDSQRLIEALKKTTEGGATVIMVSHKLSEILDATSRVVLLLDGRIARDSPTPSLDRGSLVSMLVAHEKSEVAGEGTSTVGQRRLGEELLRLERVHGGRVKGVDLVVKAGEVVGVTGLPGSGLHDIAYLAHGSLNATGGSVKRLNGAASALVPPYRETQGGFLEQSVTENLTISSLTRWRTRAGFVNRRRERSDAEKMVGRLSVKPADPRTLFGTLSGGNKQKVILGRALLARPAIYVLCEPTRGVDVGTRNEIYKLIAEIAADGSAVLIVSSDSEDLLAVCDTIAVINDGKIDAILATRDASPQDLEAFI